MDEQLDNQVSDDPTDYDVASKDAALELSDKPFICVMCKMHKTWTVGEQEFMQNLKTQGLIERVKEPKRCSDCRAALKRAA
jgi:hypothetical protein